jgi:polysaccharide export outer membrane protein
MRTKNYLKNILYFIALLVTVLLFGCSNGNVRPLEELATPKEKSTSYIVKAGDVLMVQVWGEPKLSGEVIVRQDGYFSNPLVNDIPAEGLTLTEVGEELSERLKEYIPGASAKVALSQSAPTVYYLSGQFLKPGEYRTDKIITLLQGIATGGGFAPFADESNIILIRKHQGEERRYKFDYGKLVEGKQPNPDLKTGDIISIR